jgi:hypothetical protein
LSLPPCTGEMVWGQRRCPSFSRPTVARPVCLNTRWPGREPIPFRLDRRVRCFSAWLSQTPGFFHGRLGVIAYVSGVAVDDRPRGVAGVSVARGPDSRDNGGRVTSSRMASTRCRNGTVGRGTPRRRRTFKRRDAPLRRPISHATPLRALLGSPPRCRFWTVSA